MITRPLVILGAGRIARALVGQLLAREDYVTARHGLALPVVAVANRRFVATGTPYLDRDTLAGIAADGLEDGVPVRGNPSAYHSDYLLALARSSDERAIVVDLTAADDSAPLLLAALDADLDVALANKKPLCADYGAFVGLTAHPRGRLAYEATVGAGLPIIGTLRALADAGDELIDATACLSGTLGYVCSELDDGTLFSTIIPQARERGFTEPDPREDLSGIDVRRKAVILARTLGMRLDLNDIPDEPFVPRDDRPLEDWLGDLGRHDTVLAERARAAHEQGLVLRYVARLLPGRCDVGLKEVPRLSAAGRLRGTDNLLTARTRFYDERPLTISGPGAGPQVTAAGVFGDLLRLAGIA